MGKHDHEGAKGMAKGFLVAVSILLGGAVLMGLCCSVMPDLAGEVSSRGLTFPLAVENTQLRVLRLSAYTGPFWEDRSTASLADTGALLVENTGSQPLERGAVVLEWGQEQLVFEISHLPPGEMALVLEKDGQALPDSVLTACYGWSDCGCAGLWDAVSVEDAGGSAVAVTNRTDRTLPMVRLCYKTCRSGVYLGGTSCSHVLRRLLPGERRVVPLQHYICGQSTVVHVCPRQ